MEEKQKKLYDLLKKIPAKERPKLLIFTENGYLVCNKKTLGRGEHIYKSEELGSVSPDDRGGILEIFTKIELVLNELIIDYIKPMQNEEFNNIIDYVDFFTKAKLLNKWGVLDYTLKEKLLTVKGVRNSYAHSWSDKEINYKGKPLIDRGYNNFSNFCRDLEFAWKSLLDRYKKIQPNIDDLIKLYEQNK